MKQLRVLVSVFVSLLWHGATQSTLAVTRPLAYAANGGFNTVISIDTQSGNKTSLRVDGSPDGIVITPDQSTLYVTQQNLNSVAVINIAQWQVTNTIPVGAAPAGIAIAPDGHALFV